MICTERILSIRIGLWWRTFLALVAENTIVRQTANCFEETFR